MTRLTQALMRVSCRYFMPMTSWQFGGMANAMPVLTLTQQHEIKDTGKVIWQINEPTVRPAAVMEYTINMDLVDKHHMQIGFVDCVHKSCWHMKLFLHIVNMPMLNACSMYQIKTSNRPSYANFYLYVISQIIQKYQVIAPTQHICHHTDHQISLYEVWSLSIDNSCYRQEMNSEEMLWLCAHNEAPSKAQEYMLYV